MQTPTQQRIHKGRDVNSLMKKKTYKDFPHVIYLNRNMNTVIMEQQIFTVGSYMKRFGLDVSQLTALKKERNVCAQTK